MPDPKEHDVENVTGKGRYQTLCKTCRKPVYRSGARWYHVGVTNYGKNKHETEPESK